MRLIPRCEIAWKLIARNSIETDSVKSVLHKISSQKHQFRLAKMKKDLNILKVNRGSSFYLNPSNLCNDCRNINDRPHVMGMYSLKWLLHIGTIITLSYYLFLTEPQSYILGGHVFKCLILLFILKCLYTLSPHSITWLSLWLSMFNDNTLQSKLRENLRPENVKVLTF